MANADTNKRSSFRYIWTIENISELTWFDLSSPPFTIKSIGDFVWNIEIYNEHRNIEYTVFYCRVNTNRFSDGYSEKNMDGLDFDFSFLGADGSQLVSPTRRKGKLLVTMIDKETLLERWAELVPNNTLTVQFRMWGIDREIPTDVCYARTRFQTHTGSFIWDVDEFSALTSSSEEGFRRLASDERRVYALKPFIKERSFIAFLILYIKKSDYSDRIKVGFLVLKGRDYVVNCALSVLDANGKVIASQMKSIQKDYGSEILTFPYLVAKNKLTANKDLFLPNDTLVLRCSFEVCTGVSSNAIEYFTPNVSSVIEEKEETLDSDDDSLQFEDYFYEDGNKNSKNC